MTILGIISAGGIIAFALTMAEYLLLITTSVLTFSVAGIVKEIITISISTAIFGDRFTFMSIVGLIISLLGIIGYNILRMSESSKSDKEHSSNSDVYNALHVEEAEEFQLEDHIPIDNDSDHYILKNMYD
jgi:solute carrier family 35 protein C2